MYVPSSFTLNAKPEAPAEVTFNAVPVASAPVKPTFKALPVTAALLPDAVMLARSPVSPVEVEVRLSPFPLVKAFTSMFRKLPVVRDVDCKSKTPRVSAPFPIVVAVLLVRTKEAAVFEVSVTSSFPEGLVVPIPTLSLDASIERVLVSKERPLTPPVKAKLVSLAKVQEAALAVTVSPEASPMVVLPVEERVVKTPEFGVPLPMVPGEAHVPPLREEALLVPEPLYVREAPVPTTMAAVVLVALVIPEKGRAEAVMPTVQVRVPVALATVQPVLPAPPPIKISPVPVPFKFRAPVPLASRLKAMLVSEPVAAWVTALPVVEGVKVVPLAAVPATRAKLNTGIPDWEAVKMF